jgi:endonuclease YncB( thermonuclease family)
MNRRPPLVRGLLLTLAVCLLILPPVDGTAKTKSISAQGEVIGIVDGDTIDVLVSATTAVELGFPRRKSPLAIRLRLDQVDTPERGQPWAKRAKQALSDLVFGKIVRFTSNELDRYDRDVSVVYLGETWVNAWLIENGHGWAYRRYAKQPALLCSLEAKARVARRGLWSQPPNTWLPPWIWRKHSADPAIPDVSLQECLHVAAPP